MKRFIYGLDISNGSKHLSLYISHLIVSNKYGVTTDKKYRKENNTGDTYLSLTYVISSS